MVLAEYGVLVVGAGSIGRRHLRNLRALGVQRLAACDPAEDRLAPVVEELGIQGYADYEEALAQLRPEIVFVCTPPVLHLPQTLAAVRANAHVFVEKPLAHALDDVDALVAEAAARERIVQVGYNLRFHPGLRRVKELLDQGTIGRVLWAQLEVGQYLPDWRPWQDYRQSYTARRALGGGIVLDASHELDYLVWLLGVPSAVLCLSGRVSSLEVDVEDCATVLLRFPSGAQADVHLDFVQRAYSRSCKLAGEEGTLLWDYTGQQVRLYRAERAAWEVEEHPCELNQMYLAEVEAFFDSVARGAPPSVGLADGRLALRLVLAAHEAAAEGRSVQFG